MFFIFNWSSICHLYNKHDCTLSSWHCYELLSHILYISIIFSYNLNIFLFLQWGKKQVFAQISPLLCLFNRHILLSCTFAFKLSKVNPLLKVRIPKCVVFFKRSNIVHSQKCIYKNGSRKVAFTELPQGKSPLNVNFTGNRQRAIAFIKFALYNLLVAKFWLLVKSKNGFLYDAIIDFPLNSYI